MISVAQILRGIAFLASKPRILLKIYQDAHFFKCRCRSSMWRPNCALGNALRVPLGIVASVQWPWPNVRAQGVLFECIGRRARSFQLIQMRQPRQNHLLTRLLNLTRQKNLVQNRINLLSPSAISSPLRVPYPFFFLRVFPLPLFLISPLPILVITYLIKIKHQIQLTHVPKKRIQHLHEKMYSLQIRQLVVVCVDARAEEKTCVPPIYDFGHIAELDEVGLVLLVAWGDEAVDLERRV
jgi:hypothetical protein